MPAQSGKGGRRTMIKFLMGVIVGILIFFFFLYFGGGKTVKKVGEGLTDTGKKMEVMEEMVKKEKGEIEKGVQKKIYKENKDLMKKVQ
jgi:uncharacterized membrane protein (DUF106 family)